MDASRKLFFSVVYGLHCWITLVIYCNICHSYIGKLVWDRSYTQILSHLITQLGLFKQGLQVCSDWDWKEILVSDWLHARKITFFQGKILQCFSKVWWTRNRYARVHAIFTLTSPVPTWYSYRTFSVTCGIWGRDLPLRDGFLTNFG